MAGLLTRSGFERPSRKISGLRVVQNLIFTFKISQKQKGTYSYGDSPGFSPDSLFIRNIGTACFAKIMFIYTSYHKMEMFLFKLNINIFKYIFYIIVYQNIKTLNTYIIFSKKIIILILKNH